MYSQALITFRETFEAVIIVVIILSYLRKLEKHSLIRPLLIGSVFGVFISILLGLSAYVVYSLIELKELVEAVAPYLLL